MKIEEIVAALEHNEGIFPKLALERAIEEQGTITPILLSSLERARDNLPELLEDSAYFLHLYALYLLAQFREQKAYAPIVAFFSLPGEISLDLTGEVVTEDLHRILASVYHGDLVPIEAMIENPAVNEYVRSASLRSLTLLVAKNLLPREEVIEYFRGLFQGKLAQDDSYVWTALVIESIDLCAVELEDDIRRLFEEDVIDPFMISLEDVESSLGVGIEKALENLRQSHDISFIEDTIAEMEGWYCFHEKKSGQAKGIGSDFDAWNAPKKQPKSQAKKKRKMQKDSRRKNRRKS
jgi:hypothetical protein